MKKRYLGVSTVLMTVLLTACGQGDAETNTSEVDEEMAVLPIVVDLTVPETGESDEAIQLFTTVTHDEKKVDDADEVEYEIWEEGKKEDSWKVQSNQSSDGIYEGEATFDHNGLYHVQVHVTARDMHTMPLKEITIGEGTPSEEVDAADHGDHGTEGFSIHFMQPEDVKVNEPTSMIVHLQQDDAPIEKARVRLEVVSNDKADEAQWIDLNEDKAGEYTGDVTFEEAGTASVAVHVEDEHDLHEQETHEITISE